MKGKTPESFSTAITAETVVNQKEDVVETRNKANIPLHTNDRENILKDINFLLNWQTNDISSIEGNEFRNTRSIVEDDRIENISVDMAPSRLSLLNSIHFSTDIEKTIKISKKNFYRLTAHLFHITTCLVKKRSLRVPIFLTVINLLMEVESKIVFDGEIFEFLNKYYQLIGLSLMSISFKYFCKNLDKILFEDLIAVSHKSISVYQLKECEMFLLKILNFNVQCQMDDFYTFLKSVKQKVSFKFKVTEKESKYLSACLIFYSACKLKTTNENLINAYLLDSFQLGRPILDDISNRGMNLFDLEKFKEFIKSDDEFQFIIKKIY